MSRHIPIPKDSLVRLMRCVGDKVGHDVAKRLDGWHDVLTAIGLDEANKLLARPVVIDIEAVSIARGG